MTLPTINVLVSDDDTERLLTNYAFDSSCVKIRFTEPNLNVDNDLKSIEALIGHKLNSLVYDFYSIALAIYIADLQIKKKAKTGCRTISLLISVSDLNKWNSAKQKLEGTLRFLSGDNFKFYFVQSSKTATPFRFEEKDNRVVSLLSGGLDSLSGAAWLFEHHLEPVLVSHAAKNTLFKVQNTIIEKLEKIAGKNLLFGQISARPKLGKNLYAKEYSEPCRSFLYLTLGMIFALEIGIKRMFVFENGIMALNIPLTSSRIYLSTRTTHPAFMKDYSGLINTIFGAQISIENPFLTLTKGEVAAYLNKNGFKDIVKDSYSCASESYRYQGISTSEYPHCGVCLPCLVRRIAIHSGGLWNNDSKYAFDILAEYNKIPDEGKKLVLEMLDFGHRLENCKTDEETLNEFPQFLIEDFDPVPFIDMYRRQAAQTKEFLRQKAHASFKEKIKQWL